MTPSERRPGHPLRPVRPAPPRRRATAGDTLFALAVAVLGVLVAGAVLLGGDGEEWLAGLLPGPAGAATPSPTPAAATPTPSTAPGPILPAASPSLASSPTPGPTPAPSAEPTPAPTAAPTPAAAGPFTINLYRKGVFVHQADKEWCVAAAAQNMLNVIRLVEDGTPPDTSARTQKALYRRIEQLTTWEDSHNGGTGPGGWAALLTEKGYPYEVRVYPQRSAALKAAAIALRETRRPVGILAWAGVHSWVLTGYTATADPASGRSFSLSTARVIDPWYPWVSDRWPKSEKPNAPRDAADLKANILPWKLASGPYQGRDGKFLLVVPLDG
jgi:hypothetical protein